jgi:hypothetical protein
MKDLWNRRFFPYSYVLHHEDFREPGQLHPSKIYFNLYHLILIIN